MRVIVIINFKIILIFNKTLRSAKLRKTLTIRKFGFYHINTFIKQKTKNKYL